MIPCICMASSHQIVEMDKNATDKFAADATENDDVGCLLGKTPIVSELEVDNLVVMDEKSIPLEAVMTELFVQSDDANVYGNIDEDILDENHGNVDEDIVDSCRNSKIDMIILQSIDRNRKNSNSSHNISMQNLNKQHLIVQIDKENYRFIKKLTPRKQSTCDENTIYTPHTQIKMLYSPVDSPEEVIIHISSPLPLTKEIGLNMDDVLRQIFNKLRKDKETINIMQFISVYRRLCNSGEKGNLFKEMTLANKFSKNGTINEDQFVKGFNEYILTNNPRAMQLLQEEVSNTKDN